MDSRDAPSGDHKAGGVDNHHGAQAPGGVEDPAERRSHQPTEVVVERVQRIGGDQPFLADQARQQRGLGGIEKQGKGAGGQAHEVEQPEQIGGADGEQWEQRDGAHQIGNDHRPLPIPPIDEDPSKRTQHNARQQRGGEDRPGGEGGPGQGVGMKRQRGEQRTVAGNGDQPGDPQQREVPLPQGGEHLVTFTGG